MKIVFLILSIQFFLLCSIQATPNKNSGDKGIQQDTHPNLEAMVDFYRSTGGPGWLSDAKKGWREGDEGTSCNPCKDSWFGVECDEAERIICISLIGQGLRGEFLPTFKGLKYLNTLNLFGNQLSGSIPDFEGFVRLKSLDLSDNDFTGTLPDFSDLEDLEILTVAYNELSGSFPNFSNITNLGTIICHYNQFNGTLPNFENIRSLYVFHAHENQFSGSIPQAYSRRSELVELYLNDNDLEGCFNPHDTLCSKGFNNYDGSHRTLEDRIVFLYDTNGYNFSNNPDMTNNSDESYFCSAEAMLPVGSVCDDGLSSTPLDTIDAPCNCSGGPCPDLFIGNDTTIVICEGQSILTLTSNLKADSYVWSTGATSPTIEILESGTYSLEVNFKSSCTLIDEINITEIEQESLHVSNDSSVCNNTEILTLYASIQGGNWEGPSIDPISGIIDLLDLPIGDYTYIYQVDQSGCPITEQVIVSVIDFEGSIDFGESQIICDLENDFILNQPNPSGGIWKGEGIVDSINGIVNPNLISTKDILHFEYCIIGANGCQGCAITEVQTLIPLGIGNDTTLCNVSAFEISANISDANYFWNTGEITQSITIDQSGSYSVEVVISEECFQRNEIQVVFLTTGDQCNDGNNGTINDSIRDDCSCLGESTPLRLTNIITPNNDGVNDQLRFSSDFFIPNSVLIIYNRWGNQVFRMEEYDNSWNGGSLPDGIYYYILQRDNGTQKNTLTLSR